jgi:hypothetical protein
MNASEAWKPIRRRRSSVPVAQVRTAKLAVATGETGDRVSGPKRASASQIDVLSERIAPISGLPVSERNTSGKM